MNSGEQPSVPLRDLYVEQLRYDASRLIWLAYTNMVAGAFRQSEEDDITDEIVARINLIKEDPQAPEWVERYEVHEQRRKRVGSARGKSRPIIDIEIEPNRRGVRPRLGFEAKRLGAGHTVRKYLGPDGLGAFVCGHYPMTHGEAGMIAYIQQRTVSEWTDKISRELKRASAKHSAIEPCELQRCLEVDDFQLYRTRHTDTLGNSVLVVHLLLDLA